MEPFGARLRSAMDARGPLCVGIDPHPGLLAAWGLHDDRDGLERFAFTVAEALAGTVAVLKPQSAFFERHGSAGIEVLERVVRAVRTDGALVLLDVKRGDIGSTTQAYADAYLDPRSPLAADAVTAHPYLGFGSLDPLLDTAEAHGAGVFVVAVTSNPDGEQVQTALTAGGRTVAAQTLAGVAERNRGRSPMGSVGAVVGVTASTAVLAGAGDLDVNGPLLAPGLGAQGGSASDLARIFRGLAGRVLPSTSREVLSAGPHVGALRGAASAVAADVARALTAATG